MRIFKKTKKANGRRHIYLFGIKVFSYKKEKGENIQTIEYLKRYSYVLDHIPQQKVSHKYKNCIWQCWLQGLDNRPKIVEVCIESVKKYANNRQVIILTKDSISDYIDLPDFIWEKYNKGIITNTHFSDIIRAYLLAQYGGTWIDATVLLTAPIPKVIENSDFFVFKDQYWMNYPQIPSFQFLHYLPSQECLSSWFMHSQPNLLMSACLGMLFEYWKNEKKLIDYFLFHKMFTMAVMGHPECQMIYKSMPLLSNFEPHQLQNLLSEKFNTKIYKEIQSWSPIHKLTYKKHIETPNSFYDYIINHKNKLSDLCDIYITIHDQDLILKLEENKVFWQLPDYKYIFLGNRPTDKLSKYTDKVIIAKNLKNNIEHLKSLLDFTGWYAIAKNGLNNKKFIAVIQYDYIIKDNFEQKLKKSLLENGSAVYALYPAHITYDFIKKEDKKYRSGFEKALQKNYQIDLTKFYSFEKPQDLAYGNSFVCSQAIFKKYIEWMLPMMQEISEDEYAGHSIERSVAYFPLIHHIQTIPLGDIVRHLNAGNHEQSYQAEEVKLQKKIELNDFLNGFLT